MREREEKRRKVGEPDLVGGEDGKVDTALEIGGLSIPHLPEEDETSTGTAKGLKI